MVDIHPETKKRLEKLEKLLALAAEVPHKEKALSEIGYDVDSRFALELIKEYNTTPQEILSHGLHEFVPNNKGLRVNFVAEVDEYADRHKVPEDLFIRTIFYLGMVHLLLGISVQHKLLPVSLLRSLKG